LASCRRKAAAAIGPRRKSASEWGKGKRSGGANCSGNWPGWGTLYRVVGEEDMMVDGRWPVHNQVIGYEAEQGIGEMGQCQFK
jgi:hypothetical protein